MLFLVISIRRLLFFFQFRLIVNTGNKMLLREFTLLSMLRMLVETYTTEAAFDNIYQLGSAIDTCVYGLLPEENKK